MSMKKQMSLFEYGGIADDGMNKDPVSGNNIPPGSLAKEVRDDIPAMLSEGEYVVPADVLRYYGVNFFENLRGQAKQGLNTMEQNGRIGGTPMTEQDVARNMQQPMMAPAPVQAAQGAMMQSPLRVQQQQAPQAMGNVMQQPVMANQGTMVQGFDEGTTGATRSSWTPARARYSSPMFQGTSSQQANIQTAQDQAAAELLTFMRTHFNKDGESIQIAYEGTDPNSATPKAGQEELLASYPLTEAEYGAYQSEVKKSNGGGDGGGGGDATPTPTGSDTSWMDGIDFGDSASVKNWVESDDGLGMSALAKGIGQKGGILGAIPAAVQANDIAKARGVLEYYKSIGDEEMVSYLEPKIKEAIDQGGLVVAAFDKLGFLTGNSYFKQITTDPTKTPEGFKFRAASQKEEVAKNAEAQAAEDSAAAAEALAAFQDDDDDDDGNLFPVTAVSIDRDPMGQGTMSTTYGSGDDAFTATASFEEDPEFDYGVNEGGLMATPKPKKKKKSKPKKTGLAGKK